MKRLSSLVIINVFASCLALTLSACSGSDEGDKPRLEGKRISILDLDKGFASSASKTSQAPSSINIKIPQASLNKEWPQAGGYPHHAMQNLSLGQNDSPLERIWKSSIGRGNAKAIPLNAKPVIAAGHVFTLDTNNKVRAFHSQTGKSIWAQDVQSLKEDDNVIAGGLAYAGGVLFVTSGYNEVLALDPQNGEIYWRRTLSAGSRAAPTIMNGRVFINTMNNTLVALNASNGAPLWTYEGTGETTGLLGAASPAANEQMVIAPFSNGSLVALRVENGSTVWEDSLSGTSRLGGIAGLSDIRGLPVMTGGRVIAASFGNKIAAFDQNNGRRLWQKEIGSAETPWVAGETIYVLTPSSNLVALSIYDGSILWTHALPKANWTGPVMAGGKLFVAGSKGRVVELNPRNGQVIEQWNAGDDISIAPIIAEGALYILSDDGTLSAYR